MVPGPAQYSTPEQSLIPCCLRRTGSWGCSRGRASLKPCVSGSPNGWGLCCSESHVTALCLLPPTPAPTPHLLLSDTCSRPTHAPAYTCSLLHLLPHYTCSLPIPIPALYLFLPYTCSRPTPALGLHLLPPIYTCSCPRDGAAPEILTLTS